MATCTVCHIHTHTHTKIKHKLPADESHNTGSTDRVCVYANQCLVFSFFLFNCSGGGGDFPLVFAKTFNPWKSSSSVRAGHTHKHTRTKASLCLTPDDEQPGQSGASLLGG